MNKDFFENSEAICNAKFIEFNNNTKMFHGTKRIEGKEHRDWTGYTVNKLGEVTNWNIELKNRNLLLLEDGTISGSSKNGTYIGDTLYIENHKITDLLLDRIIGLEALYMNFTLNGYTIIYNLNNLKRRPKRTFKNNIYSNGYEKKEDGRRQELYIVDAAIYDKDFNLIKKAGEEWKQTQTSS